MTLSMTSDDESDSSAQANPELSPKLRLMLLGVTLNLAAAVFFSVSEAGRELAFSSVGSWTCALLGTAAATVSGLEAKKGTAEKTTWILAAVLGAMGLVIRLLPVDAAKPAPELRNIHDLVAPDRNDNHRSK
jgi:hypothetical protein